MCERCNDPDHLDFPEPGRRKFLKGGAGLAASGLAAVGVAATSTSPAAAQQASSLGRTPFETRAYGTTGATAPIEPMRIRRRAIGPRDVLIEVLYSGICHTDIHQVRDDWKAFAPTLWPIIPGHEIVGRVVAVGASVAKFRVGDPCGVGCMVQSCGECENCLADLEQHCLQGMTLTYNSPDSEFEGHTLGGFAEHIVVNERFVVRIPSNVDQAAFAPLLCAGLTTFSPLQRWDVERGQRVGVVGLGGLGHMAVKLAAVRGADVTVFTSSPAKVADAARLGAKAAVVWTDDGAMEPLAGQFDLLISTIPYPFPVNPFLNILRVDGTLVNLGNLLNMETVSGASMIFGRKHIAGSLIGGMAETQQVVDYCAARNIKADIELIRPDQINEAMNRVFGKDVRYRFVIDMKAA